MPEQFTLKELYDVSTGVGRKPESYTLAPNDITFVTINVNTDTPDTIALTLGEFSNFVLRTYSVYDSLSADWESVYTNSNANSTNWEKAVSVTTTVNTNSADWQSVYAGVRSNSADWESVYTNSNVNSGEWEKADSVNTTVNTNSADWESVYSHIRATSATDVIRAYAKVNANGQPAVAHNCSVVRNSIGQYTITTQNYDFISGVFATVSGPKPTLPGRVDTSDDGWIAGYWLGEAPTIESTSIDSNADGVIEVKMIAATYPRNKADDGDNLWLSNLVDTVFYIIICGT